MLSRGLVLHFKCWFYVDPKQLAKHNYSFADFVRSKVPNPARWEVSPLQDRKVEKSKGDKVFVPLEVQLKPIHTSDGRQQQPDMVLFEEMWTCVVGLAKHPKFKTAVGLDRKANIVFYSLWDPSRPKGSEFSRWMLPLPAEPITLPAERVEQALYNLVSVKLRRRDDAHKNCHGTAVFECIENLLYQQKLKYEALVSCMDELAKTKSASILTIDQCAEAIEGLDKALFTISKLLSKHVGKAAPPTSRSRIILALKKLFMKKMASVPIESEVIEKLKINVGRDMAAMQRVAPLMMAHIRLCHSDHRAVLKDVFDRTEDGVEKNEMPSKMAIEPENLNDTKSRETNFLRVRVTYDREYSKVIAEIEAMSKACGREFVAGGGASTKPGRKSTNGKRGWWKKRKAAKKCSCGGEAKEAVISRAVEDILEEKC